MKKIILLFVLILPVFLLVFLGQVSNVNAASGTISASPNPCTITQGSNTCSGTGKTCCTSTITWGTTDASSAVVCVHDGTEEKVFASGILGRQDATWIQQGIYYEFRLKTPYTPGTCNGTQLDSVEVTAATLYTPTPAPTPSPTPSPLPPPQNLQAQCSPDGTTVTATWNPISQSIAYVIRANADPVSSWVNVPNLGTYNDEDPPQIAPTTGDKDFTANTQGNTSTTYRAKVVTGLHYYVSIQGVRQGEQYPYSGQSAGVDVTCTAPSPVTLSGKIKDPQGEIIDYSSTQGDDNTKIRKCEPDASLTYVLISHGTFSVPNVVSGTKFCFRAPATLPSLHGDYIRQGDTAYECQWAGGYWKPDVCGTDWDLTVDNAYNFTYAPPVPLVCDFNENRSYDDGDITFWKDIFLGLDTDPGRTNKADCSRDGAVNLVDFNRWRNMKYLNFIGN